MILIIVHLWNENEEHYASSFSSSHALSVQRNMLVQRLRTGG